jgi:hypothetical protein
LNCLCWNSRCLNCLCWNNRCLKQLLEQPLLELSLLEQLLLELSLLEQLLLELSLLEQPLLETTAGATAASHTPASHTLAHSCFTHSHTLLLQATVDLICLIDWPTLACLAEAHLTDARFTDWQLLSRLWSFTHYPFKQILLHAAPAMLPLGVSTLTGCC